MRMCAQMCKYVYKDKCDVLQKYSFAALQIKLDIHLENDLQIELQKFVTLVDDGRTVNMF